MTTTTQDKTKSRSKKNGKNASADTPPPQVQAGRPRLVSDGDCIQRSYEGVLLVGYTESNQQGDVNSNGHPRIDPVTGHARLGATALPRKMRDLFSAEGKSVLYRRDPYMVREDDGKTLTIDDMVQSVREEEGLGLSPSYVKERFGDKATKSAGPKLEDNQVHELRRAVIEKYEDLRYFGALLNVGSDHLDNVRGAVRIQTARSVTPVMPIQDAMTRGMITGEKERSSRGRVIGNRTTIPFALYPIPFSVVQPYAREVGFGIQHLRGLFRAMIYAIANDQSPSRRGVVYGMWVFQSPNHLIMRPTGGDWLGTVLKITPKPEDPITIRGIEDYEIKFDRSRLPRGVEAFDLAEISELIDDADAFGRRMF